MLKPVKYRVQNFRNIDDSGWIKLERITAFVGRNESGKTTLLKALHKFNPATPEPYNAQREFPRDRYTRDCKNPGDWPVCSVSFEIHDPLWSNIIALLGPNTPLDAAICTRYYDGHLSVEFVPPIENKPLDSGSLIEALDTFAKAARRLEAPSPEQEEACQTLRTDLALWASRCQEKLTPFADLRDTKAVAILSAMRIESETKTNPHTADLVEALQEVLSPVLTEAQNPPLREQVTKFVKSHLPIFIYFENYGILDSAIYLPRFLEDLADSPQSPRVRTINALFKHVGLTAKEIADLGQEQAQQARAKSQQPTHEMIRQDQENKEARAIKLNSGSLDITKRFNTWYEQRRHTISYQADGGYFRVWVADDRRPGVNIELEGRSKGFQWFFSFYLIFLVESDEGHKDAVLLLDEPGLHLHPTAQQGLLSFFEKISERNQLVYSTHSPFLIDGEHLHRVRPVTEDTTGHSRINADTWPSDRETIFPLQAAAGYAMVRGLFRHKKNVLVEGMSDYYYLHALEHQCHVTGRKTLPQGTYIIPCGGTKLVGILASLFLGQEIRPLILLDGDEAGRARRNALIMELYAEHLNSIVMLDEAMFQPGTEVEVEDLLGEDIILPILNGILEEEVKLSATNRKTGSLPDRIKSWAAHNDVELPAGWKASVALHLVSTWAENKTILPDAILNRAEKVFEVMQGRFLNMEKPRIS
jgi:energy-coupling factor transporter ATP-binding protein EcfA2